MKKTSKKKRKNYRLRRSVRRTLGALFMISAIIVAAIPFPDAAAVDDVEELISSYDVGTGDRTPYTYTKSSNYSDLFSKYITGGLAAGEDDVKEKAYVTLSDNGQYVIYEQYEYVDRSYEGTTYGVITHYNTLYAADSITLSSSVNKKYFMVKPSDYKAFYDSGKGKDILTLNLKNANDETKKLFADYFGDLGSYTDYLAAYSQYEKDLAAWNKKPVEQRFEEDRPAQPADLQCYPNQMSDKNKLKYYCYCLDGFKDLGYTLTYVNDKTSTGGSSTDNFVYLIQGEADPPGKYKKDENNFIVENTASIIAIGENAFADVKNVRSMTLSGNIKYIGDNAFADSFMMQEANLAAVDIIGNGAFSSCSQLKSVTMNYTSEIGKDAFYGCTSLNSVSFPHQMSKIGDGAFAGCTSLDNVDLSNITANCVLGEAAFYDCSLGGLNVGNSAVTTLGKGCFASNNPGKDKLINVDLENSGITTIGEMLFSGRQNLVTVVMPHGFGSDPNEEVTLPENTFVLCTQLGKVTFPSTAGNVTYGNTLYNDVINDQFVVAGPATKAFGADASERIATWSCRNHNGSPVPYMYTDTNGQTFYEVRSADYLLGLQIDQSANTATLKKCDFVKGVNPETTQGKLEVPVTVGPYKVVAFGDNCFEQVVKDTLTEIEIKDNSIQTIGNDVFKDCTKLRKLVTGDSVQSIGDRSFQGCTSLSEAIIGPSVTRIGNSAFEGCNYLDVVTFMEPVGGASSFPKENLGTKAFSTGGNKLTFRGIVDPSYGPFAWAMEDSNYVQQNLGIRVCYKTPASTALGSILNPATYSSLEKRADDETDENYRNKQLFKDYLNDKPYFTVIMDNQNNLPTLVDYSHYNDLPDYLKGKYESKGEMTPLEEAAVKATLDISIPAGIESIDVLGYINDSSKEFEGVTPSNNGYNISTYFRNRPYWGDYATNGLFNGNFDEFPADDSHEKVERGNDNIRSISMNTVRYLPNVPLMDATKGSGAFYSCENLETVNLGSAMEDVGELPFLGCYKLSSIGSSSPAYTCNNKILYENNPDGTKTIVECLGARGSAGDVSVNTENDPDLANVSTIKKGAFSDLPDLKRIDFTDNTILTDIPDQCFEKDPRLSQVILPPTVRTIGEKAFSGDQDGMSVTIYGREVSMASNAFDDTVDPTVVSYKDSAVYNQAKRYGVEVVALDETFKVQFFDFDGVTPLTDVQYIEQGKNAEPPEEEPTRDHYKFTGWNKSYKNITQNLDIIAMYEYDQNAGSDDPNDPNNPNNPNGNGGNGNGNGGEGGLYTLTVSGGSGGGQYAAGTSITILANAPASGSMFANWSSDDGIIFDNSTAMSTTIVMPAKDATVVANYTGQYLLKVNFGSGTGSYASGTQVTISAIDPPAGKVFDKWTTTTSGLTIAEPTKSTTTITMPGSNAEITATYKNGSSASGNSTSTKPKSKNGTTVNITKPGISNTGTASAYVNGSSDNFIVKISESQLAADEVQKALNKEYPDMSRIKYFAMDISLYDATGNTKITNFEGLSVNITMPIPDALKEYAGNNRIAGVVDGTLDKLNPKFTTIEGVPSISFTATHFSPYTIYVDTANLTEATGLDATPKTGDGIHPKWFLSIGLFCISLILFLKKDKRTRAITV